MSNWQEYERRKKELQRKLNNGEITQKQYEDGIKKICKDLKI